MGLIYLYGYLLVLRLINFYKKKQELKKRSQWNLVIPLYLASDYDMLRTSAQIKPGDYGLFTDYCIRLFESVKGSEHRKLVDLIRYLKLSDFHIKKIQHGNLGQRSLAAYFLGMIGETRAIPHLVNGLKEKDDFVRLAFARALARMPDGHRYVKQIIFYLTETDLSQDLVADAILNFGSHTGPALTKFLALADEITERIGFIIDLIAEVQYSPAREALTDLLIRTSDPAISLKVTRVLGELP